MVNKERERVVKERGRQRQRKKEEIQREGGRERERKREFEF